MLATLGWYDRYYKEMKQKNNSFNWRRDTESNILFSSVAMFSKYFQMK